MKKLIKYIPVSCTTAMLVTIPLWGAGCKSAPLTPQQQIEHDAAVARGDIDAANKLQDGANGAQAKGIVDMVMDFLPVPEGYKKILGGSIVALTTQLAFKRPRRVYGEALKAAGKAMSELSPSGDGPSPIQAGKELITALGSIGKVWGLQDSRPDAVSADDEQYVEYTE